ncbi:MAG: GntR family transcriptional regulator [Tabrizicola sp.]|nr:GntR family transcriptional regulator [Tabrizicola sp.]
MEDEHALYRPEAWYRAARGPRYEQLYRHLAAAIAAGELPPETQLPPERELALIADVSRVTVRKAVSQLVADGVLDQRRGAGTFVQAARPKMEHSLSALLSFTEYMRQRGKTSSSRILRRGLFLPTPDEMMALGLSAGERVARVERLRFADDTPLAIEWSSLPTDILPDPEAVETSLYDVLRSLGTAPTRAVQRITAVNLTGLDARHLMLAEGAAVLRIDRTAYVPSGRPIEFTRGLYRSDIYDFIAELRLDSP